MWRRFGIKDECYWMWGEDSRLHARQHEDDGNNIQRPYCCSSKPPVQVLGNIFLLIQLSTILSLSGLIHHLDADHCPRIAYVTSTRVNVYKSDDSTLIYCIFLLDSYIYVYIYSAITIFFARVWTVRTKYLYTHIQNTNVNWGKRSRSAN